MLNQILSTDFCENLSSLFTNAEISSLETTSRGGKKVASDIWAYNQKIIENLFKDKPDSISAKEFTLSFGGLAKLDDLRNEYFSKEIYSPNDSERLKYIQTLGVEGVPDIRDFSFYVENGCVKPVQYLLANSNVTQTMINRNIIKASGCHQEDILELLLREGPISELVRSKAFEKATDNNSFTIAKILFENGPLFDDDIYTGILQFIANGSNEGTAFLLDNFPGLVEDDIEDLLVLAVNENQREIVELFLDRYDVCYEDLHSAFYTCIQEEKWDLVEFFIDEVCISNKGKEYALCKLAETGRDTLIKKILSTEPKIKDEARGYALCAALRAGKFSSACSIASSGQAALFHLKYALGVCIQKNSPETLNHILKTLNKPVREELYEFVLKNAVLGNNLIFLEKILMENKIPQKLIEDSMIVATGCRNVPIVNALLDYRPLSNDFAKKLYPYLYGHPITHRLEGSANLSEKAALTPAEYTVSLNGYILTESSSELSEPPKKKLRFEKLNPEV